MTTRSGATDATDREVLVDGAARLGLPLNDVATTQLLNYLDLLDRWNAVHNLTAIRNRDQMVIHHLLDSLAVAPLLTANAVILDVGSGGGLPGIPLAIARPDVKVTMIDSAGKKVAFIHQAISRLGLPNAATRHTRAEAWRPGTRFAVITARALAELARIVAWTRHLIAPDGQWIALKGIRPDDEIAALPPEIRVLDIRKLEVPGLDAERHAVILSSAHHHEGAHP